MQSRKLRDSVPEWHVRQSGNSFNSMTEDDPRIRGDSKGYVIKR